MKKSCILMVFISIISLLGTALANEPARKWRSKKGGEIEAVWDIENDEGEEKILLIKDGKKYRVPIEKLSEEDIEYVQQRRNEISSSNVGEFSDFELKDNLQPKESDVEINENQAGNKKILTIKGLDYTFCYCPAGSFIMGSPESEDDRRSDEISHQVTLSHGFWMQETEVTQQMWVSVMGSNPSEFKGNNLLPVERVSWKDCQEFIKKLNKTGGIPSGFDVSLPTEAQWEYACRAGGKGAYGGTDDLDDVGWYSDNSNHKTHVVKTKNANNWGLYDMLGNVNEWCFDWKCEYPNDSVTDPVGLDGGAYRVYRGGCWSGSARICRSAFRGKSTPTSREIDLGFRLILVPNK